MVKIQLKFVEFHNGDVYTQIEGKDFVIEGYPFEDGEAIVYDYFNPTFLIDNDTGRILNWKPIDVTKFTKEFVDDNLGMCRFEADKFIEEVSQENI